MFLNSSYSGVKQQTLCKKSSLELYISSCARCLELKKNTFMHFPYVIFSRWRIPATGPMTFTILVNASVLIITKHPDLVVDIQEGERFLNDLNNCILTNDPYCPTLEPEYLIHGP